MEQITEEQQAEFSEIQGIVLDLEDNDIPDEVIEYLDGTFFPLVMEKFSEGYEGEVEEEPSAQGGVGTDFFEFYDAEGELIETKTVDIEEEQEAMLAAIRESATLEAAIDNFCGWLNKSLKVLEEGDNIEKD